MLRAFCEIKTKKVSSYCAKIGNARTQEPRWRSLRVVSFNSGSVVGGERWKKKRQPLPMMWLFVTYVEC